MTEYFALEVVVYPVIGYLDEDYEREYIKGTTITVNGLGNTPFGRLQPRDLYFDCTSVGRARAWLNEHGYHYDRPLEHSYLAERGWHGVWSRGTQKES